jgi:DNA-binding transcriptional MocR family regulator
MAFPHKARNGSGWSPTLHGRAGSKAEGILEELVQGIRSGHLRPGDRLPPQRKLAADLRVDLTTVTRAFRLAGDRGLIDANAGRGSFVAPGALAVLGPDQALPAGTIDLSMNIPPQPAAARLPERISRGIVEVLAAPNGMAHLHYQETAGSVPDRHAAAAWLERRLGPLPIDRLLVAGGAQSALFGLCCLLLEPGDTLCAGAFTYPGLKAVAEQVGFGLQPLPADEEGILPDAFAKCCRMQRPKALYVTPAADNPTTATMGAERRARIAGIAADHGVTVIEDDAYGELVGGKLPPLATLAPELAWHVATLSKCATPALRTAFVAAPSAVEAQRLAAVLRATNLMAPPLMAALASRWILDGSLSRIVHAIREENAVRQQVAAALLAGVSFAAAPGTHHLWLKLTANRAADEFAIHAGLAGLAVVPGSAFAIGGTDLQAVRVSVGAPASKAALQDALRHLARLLDEPLPRTRRAII